MSNIVTKNEIEKILVEEIYNYPGSTIGQVVMDEIESFISFSHTEYYRYEIFNIDTTTMSDFIYMIFDIVEEDIYKIFGIRITLNISYLPDIVFYIVYMIINQYVENNNITQHNYIKELIDTGNFGDIVDIIMDGFEYGGFEDKVATILEVDVYDYELNLEDIVAEAIRVNTELVKEYLTKILINNHQLIRYLDLIKKETTDYVYSQLLDVVRTFRYLNKNNQYTLEYIVNTGLKSSELGKDYRININNIKIIVCNSENKNEK